MSDRNQKIIEEYENLGEDDFLSDGIRPKVSAMEILTEMDDLSRSELDEVLAEKYVEKEAQAEEPEPEVEPEVEETEPEPEPTPAPPSEAAVASSSTCEDGKEILLQYDSAIQGGIRVTKYKDHSKKVEKLS